MVMTDTFDKLKTLQDILAEKYAVEKKIEEAPKDLCAQEELLSRLKKEFIEKNATFEEVRVHVLKLRTELAEAESNRERGEKGMDSISTHREYEALEKEIREATEMEQKVRKELQKEEKNMSELNERMKSEEELIKIQEEELDGAKSVLERSVDEMKAKLEELESEERTLIPDLDPETVFKFERIIKSKKKGIVAVKGNVCDGCHMILPAQFANKVHAGEDIIFCPYCSRILFYEDKESTEDEFFQLDDAGSLADFEDEFGDDLLGD